MLKRRPQSRSCRHAPKRRSEAPSQSSALQIYLKSADTFAADGWPVKPVGLREASSTLPALMLGLPSVEDLEKFAAVAQVARHVIGHPFRELFAPMNSNGENSGARNANGTARLS